MAEGAAKGEWCCWCTLHLKVGCGRCESWVDGAMLPVSVPPRNSAVSAPAPLGDLPVLCVMCRKLLGRPRTAGAAAVFAGPCHAGGVDAGGGAGHGPGGRRAGGSLRGVGAMPESAPGSSNYRDRSPQLGSLVQPISQRMACLCMPPGCHGCWASNLPCPLLLHP